MVSFPCTCQEPACIDLSAPDAAEKLTFNLQTTGWSPILVQNPGFPVPTHDEIEQLFRGDSAITNTHPLLLTYRSSESGGTEQEIEVKESLELERNKAMFTTTNHQNNETDGPNETVGIEKVKSWCLGLSSIARIVSCDILKLPPNTFYTQDDDDNHKNNACLDLMRVFFYHATEQPNNLGSSPHTDWGTWTVVWQDEVGGLETYCRACKKWVAVRPSEPTTGETWRCILHVGDMASIALDHSQQLGSDNKMSNPDSTTTQSCNIKWPSPRHRVLCSKEERTSLVYFGYPPVSSSIEDMHLQLKDWKLSSRGLRLPLKEYYLLHDQSKDSKEDSIDYDATFNKLKSLPLQELIQEKWKQVQRIAPENSNDSNLT